jgi:hypothetical protein
VYFEQLTESERDSYRADMTLVHGRISLFHNETVFAQLWGSLIPKVGRMLEDPNCWGVLVVRVRETHRWSPPGRSLTRRDFISSNDWDKEALLGQRDRPYGGLSVGGNKWTEDITVDICLFPSTWCVGDAEPTMVCYVDHSYATSTQTHL